MTKRNKIITKWWITEILQIGGCKWACDFGSTKDLFKHMLDVLEQSALVDTMRAHQGKSETYRMHGKMRILYETDARMFECWPSGWLVIRDGEGQFGSQHGRMHRNEATVADLYIPKREVEGGKKYFKQSKATLNAMNVHLSQNVKGIPNADNEDPH